MYIEFQKDRKYGFIDPESKKTIPAKYDNVCAFRNGYAIVKDNKWGIIDENDTVIIPFAYDLISWTENNVYAVSKCGHRGFIDLAGKYVDAQGSALPDTLQSYDFAAQLMDNFYVVEKTGLFGVAGKDGVVLRCLYDAIERFAGKYLCITKGSDCALYESDKEIIPFGYHTFKFIDTDTFIVQTYHRGEIYHGENKVCTVYGALEHVSGTIYSVKHKLDNDDECIFTIDVANGNVVFEGEQPSVPITAKYGWYGKFVEGLCEVKLFDNIGYIDTSGKDVIPCKYSKISIIDDIAFLYEGKKNAVVTSMSLFDIKEKTFITEKKYESITPYNKDLFCVRASLKKGLMNRKGKEVIPAIYEEITPTGNPDVYEVRDFSHRSFYSLKEGHVAKIDTDRYVKIPEDIRECQPFRGGYAIAENGKYYYGYINENGGIQIPFRYNSKFKLYPFKNGLARIERMDCISGSSYPTNDFSQIDSNANFVVQHEGQPAIINDNSLLFVSDFVGDTARAFDGSKWGIISPDGERKCEFIYDEITIYEDGICIVSKFLPSNGLLFSEPEKIMGLLSTNGEEITPCKFHGMQRMNDGYLHCKEGTLNNKGEFVVDHCSVGLRYESCVCINEHMYRVKSGDRYGVIDAYGKAICPCIYHEINDFVSGLSLCRKDKSAYLMTSSGKIFEIEASYAQATQYSSTYILLQKAKGAGFKVIDSIGKERFELKGFSFVSHDNDYTIVRQLKMPYNVPCTGVVNGNGQFIIQPLFDSISYDESDNTFIACLNDTTQRYTTEGLPVLKHDNGYMPLPEAYEFGGDFHCGMARVKRKSEETLYLTPTNFALDRPDENGHCDSIKFRNESPSHRKSRLWGYIDLSGSEVIECQFLHAGDYGDDVAPVAYFNHCFGYIDKDGAFVIPRHFAAATSFFNGIAAVQLSLYPSPWTYINLSGSQSTKNSYDYADAFSVESWPTLVKVNDKYGYINSDFTYKIPAVFDYAEPFKNGLAKVGFKNVDFRKNDYHYFQIGPDGKVLLDTGESSILCELDVKTLRIIYPFVSGYAIIYRTTGYGVINNEGVEVIRAVFKTLCPTGTGLFQTSEYDNMVMLGTNGHSYFKSILGLIELPSVYRKIKHLSNGLYSIENLEDKVGVINSLGKFIVECKYSFASLCNDGQHIECGVTVQRPTFDGVSYWTKDRAIYDLKGRMVIPSPDGDVLYDRRYEDFRDFSRDGLAAVKKDGLWGFVNKRLEEVIECQFSECKDFNDGLCIVTDTRGYNDVKGIIDLYGNFVVPYADYESISDFHNGVAEISYRVESARTWDERSELYQYEKRCINTRGQLIVEIDDTRYYLDSKYKWYNIIAGNLIQVYDGNTWGVVSKNMEIIIPCKCYERPLFDSGYSIVESYGDFDRHGVFSESGQSIVPPFYKSITRVKGPNIFYAWNDEGCFLYDCNGFIMSSVVCNAIVPLSFNYSIVTLDKKKYLYKNKEGIVSSGYDKITKMREGRVYVSNNNLCGLIDLNGHEIAPCVYDDIFDFKHGYAIIACRQVEDRYCYNYGIISASGKVIAECKYRRIQLTNNPQIPFLCTYGGKITDAEINVYLDKDGCCVVHDEDGVTIHVPGYFAASDFQCGRSVVHGEKGVGVIDTDFSIVTPLRVFETGSIFLQGDNILSTLHVHCPDNCDYTPKVMADDGCIYLEHGGKDFVLPQSFVYAGTPRFNLVSVMRNDKWGVFELHQNKLIIECIHDNEPIICNGFIILRDKDGDSKYSIESQSIIPVEYHHSLLTKDYMLIRKEEVTKGLFSNSKQNRFGIKDLDDNILLPCEYEELSNRDFEAEDEENYEDGSYYDFSSEYSSAYDNPYYNDALDMDQQSADFWDSL